MRRLSMEKIREIIRLKEAGLSDRMIHRALFVSRPVVKEYVEKIRSAGLDYTAIRDMADESRSPRSSKAANRHLNATRP